MAHLNKEELKEAFSMLDVQTGDAQTEEVEIKPEARELVELLFCKEKLISVLSNYLPNDDNLRKILDIVSKVISNNYELICEESAKSYSDITSTEELQALVDLYKKYPGLQDKQQEVGLAINKMITTGKVMEEMRKLAEENF